VPARIVEPTVENLAEAARILQRGDLVAFPTETVYGLGANALDARAVRKIFAAKGRPTSNPLIVHVEDEAAARSLARRWPEAAARLAAAYWPGPLTLVVEKSDAIPDLVTAGGATVGLRVPAHPVALALLRACAVPLAAPSANRSEEISPTTARHVADSLGPWVDDLLVLDGGPCRVGIESSVFDVTGDTPICLRPGVIRLDDRMDEQRTVASPVATATADPVRSPGQLARHYAPRKPLELVRRGDDAYRPLPGDGLLRLPDTAQAAAAVLYAELRRLDADPRVLRIRVEIPPNDPSWDAIRDRLRRASS
jgi:L-threonylcarbamoyladenylate synthase